MINEKQLKQDIFNAIDSEAESLKNYADDIRKHPELGFEEFRTSDRMAEYMSHLGLPVKRNLAITGVQGDLNMSETGPHLAVMGELDAIICREAPYADPITGAAHQCGHHVQQTVLLAIAAGLIKSNAYKYLDGKISFLGVPAEEYCYLEKRLELRKQQKIHFMSGKAELIHEGVFDDVDLSMMMHCWNHYPDALVVKGESNLGFVAFNVYYKGKQAHAAAEPHEGINALNAAVIGINAVNSLRETFQEKDNIRVHFIITKGGDMVNCVPDDVRLEVFVRANSVPVIESTLRRTIQAFRSGADAVGATMEVEVVPGMYPLKIDNDLFEVYKNNAKLFVPEKNFITVPTMPASTDLGDVSQIMPVLYPMAGGVDGVGHGADFEMVNFENAVLIPAKSMAATIVDLMLNQGQLAYNIIKHYQPTFTKNEYIDALNAYYDLK